MELFIYAYIAGLVGSIFMDITESYLAQRGISSGVTIEDIGRWFLALQKGTMKHTNIQQSPQHKHEVLAGKLFHYFLAGGGIALLYPMMLFILGLNSDSSHILYATIFGFVTNVFPWFWMMPSFGWGIAGVKSPHKSQTILAPTLSHIAYGLGLGITLELLLLI